MKAEETGGLRTIGSLTLCRSLLEYVPSVLDGPPGTGAPSSTGRRAPADRAGLTGLG